MGRLNYLKTEALKSFGFFIHHLVIARNEATTLTKATAAKYYILNVIASFLAKTL